MKHLLTALPLIALTAGMAFAQGAPKMPTAEIATDLGVTEAQLNSCFEANRPEPGERKAPPADAQSGQRPAEGQPKGEPGMPPEMLSCLQKANPKLTAESVQTVMQAHRPQPPQQN
jgi:hypothetical protein